MEKLKGLVSNGACFIVGDGASIDMRKDPWVPWLEEYIPKPRDPINPKNPMQVSNLFDPVTRRWKSSLLRTLVDPESFLAIQKIVLPTVAKKDKLVWTLKAKGNYTVKSAIKASLVPRNMNTQSDHLWHALWKLKLHERTKIFLWRLGSNALPSNLRVVQRIGSGDPLCPLCGLEEESDPHIFLHCNMVKPLWFRINWGLRPDLIPVYSNLDLLNFVINPPLCPGTLEKTKNLKDQTSIQLAVTLEFFWNLRNQVVHNEFKINYLATVKNIELKILEQLKVLNLVSGVVAHFELNGVWSAPPPHVVKINVDAALNDSVATLAAVARDSSGTIIGLKGTPLLIHV